MQDVSWKVVVLGGLSLVVVGVLTYAKLLPTEVISSLIGAFSGAMIPRGVVQK